MRVKQAAERLEVSPATIYALIAAGKLRCYRIGAGRGSIRIDETHLAEFLRAAESGSGPPPAPAPTPAAQVKLKHLRL